MGIQEKLRRYYAGGPDPGLSDRQKWLIQQGVRKVVEDRLAWPLYEATGDRRYIAGPFG